MKRIFTSLLVVLAALLMPLNILAADPDLGNDYTLVKSVTWGDGVNIAGSGACAHTAYDTGNKKQQTLTILTAPGDAAGWIAMQAWTDGSGKGWWNRSEKGLYCVNAGRSACVFGDDLTTGWLVVFECSQAASNVITLTNAAGEPDGTFSYATSEDGKSYFCTITATENAYVGFCGNKNNGYVSKISVYKPINAVVATTYTINYVDMDGNTLKDAVTYDAIGGAAITLSDADKANIVVGEDTYVYDSDNIGDQTVAEDGSTVITVKFHKAQNFNYTVNEMCAGTAARVTNSFSYETATVTAPYRKYNAVEGQLYTKGATNKEYNYKFTLTQEGQVENLDYTAVEGVDNVVFLTEGEDVVGLTPCNSANTAIRSSNSASAYATEDVTIVTLPAGKYKMHAVIYDASKTPDSHWIFKAGETQIADFNCTTVNIQEFDSEEFTLATQTDIIMAAGGNNNMGLDMLYIMKTGDVEAPVITLKTIVLYPGVWDVENTEEKYAAYAWNAEGNAWFPFVAVEGVLATQIPDNYTGIILTRINPEGTDPDPWKNVWNQTDDIDFTAIADGTVFTITGWGEGDGAKSTYTTSTPIDIDAAKAQLTEAIAKAKALNAYANDADLASAIATAETAVAGDDAAAIVSAAKGLETAATTAAKTVLTKAVELGNTIGIDVTAAQALLDKEDATAEELAAALTALVDNAKPAAKTVLENAQAFFNTFDGEAATTLAEDFTAVTTALEGTDVNAMVAAAQALIAKATPAAKAAMEKVMEYFELINDEPIITDVTALKAAMEANNLQGIMAAAKKLETDFPTAAAAYVDGVKKIADEKTYGEKGLDELNAAIADAGLVIQAEASTIVQIGAAIRSLVLAVKAYQEANLPEWTATFNNNADPAWEEVYAYAYYQAPEGQEGFAQLLGNWPGKKLEKNAETGLYDVIIKSELQPSIIIFNNGIEGEGAAQTDDLAFENGKAYAFNEKAPAEDYTKYIVNADLAGEGGFDATGTKGIDGSGIVKVGNAAAFDFKQTIEDLPAGKYLLTAKAAYRYGADEQAEYDAMQNTDVITKLVQLYATVGTKTVATPVQNRYDGASDTDYANGNGSVTVNGKFVPNSSNAVIAWFNFDQYINEVEFNLPADGAVTIGINRIGTPESDYTVIGPWTLTRLGDAEIEPEPVIADYYLVGNMTNWVTDGVKEEFKLTKNEEAAEGIEEYMINIELKADDEFKIVKPDGEEFVWYPAGENNNYKITSDGKYDIFFRPNADGGDDWYYNVIYVAKELLDMTDHIVNPSFETGDLTGWTVTSSDDTGVKSNSNATYTTAGCDGDYLFNTWWKGNPITQTVKDLPNGRYELRAKMTSDKGDHLYLLANGEHSAVFGSLEGKGVFVEQSMQFDVLDGTATIGAIGGNDDGRTATSGTRPTTSASTSLRV